MIGVYLYSSLALVGTILFWLSYRKTKNKLIIVLFFALSGCIALFDYIIYIWGIAYVYKPGFINNDMDKQLGALVSDFFSVPSFAVFIVAYRLRWYWSVAISLSYSGIEELFRRIGIYEQFWWRSWYTFVLFLLLFWSAKVWYARLNYTHKRSLSYMTLTAALHTVKLIPIILIQALFPTREVISEWIKSLGRQGPLINTPICLVTAAIVSILLLKKANRVWLAAVICANLILDLMLRRLKVIQSLNFWDNVYLIFLDILTIFAGIYFEKQLSNENLIHATYPH
jgi:hypothetical protein